MRHGRIGAAGALLIAAAVLATSPVLATAAAHAAEQADQADQARLVPVDGTAWRLGAGITDARPDGQQGLAFTVYNATTNPLVLVQRSLLAALDLGPDSGSEYDAAIFTGVSGQPGSSLRSLSYAINNPAGIEPCWDIAYTDASGNSHTLHVDPSTRGSDVVTTGPPQSAALGWTRYTFAIHLPSTATLTGLTLGADVSSDPPDPALVAFDEITVTSDTGVSSWSNATAFGLAGSPDPA